MWGRPQSSKPELDASDQVRQQASVAHSGLLPQAVISQQQSQDQNQGMGPPGGPSGSGENKPGLEKQQMQHFAHPMMPPPPGQYHHQYYPPYGYMPQVPPYQQPYPPPPPYNAPMPPSQPPAINHPYQHSMQPGSGQGGSALVEAGTSTSSSQQQ
ncbi:unnamed protein product [Lupinus luteus]|uniref:Uncharacterized protein n=1 Tax=Lupinus luteus TaxID=3873 RepID=A0AAV1X5F4_LUPLU